MEWMMRSDELEARGVVGVPGAADVGPSPPPHETAQPGDRGGRERADHHAGLLAAVHLLVALAVPGLLATGGGAARGLYLRGGRSGRRGLVLLLLLLGVCFLFGGGRGRGRSRMQVGVQELGRCLRRRVGGGGRGERGVVDGGGGGSGIGGGGGGLGDGGARVLGVSDGVLVEKRGGCGGGCRGQGDGAGGFLLGPRRGGEEQEREEEEGGAGAGQCRRGGRHVEAS
uniref:Uncharacterized protein n=1 Tax=Arundo donax TaxID=35708 RepID=A0A0A9DHH8_ARUDO